MIRIEQRTVTDCCRCCIAMLLGLEYEEVPDFVEAHGEWWARELAAWLEPREWGLICVGGAPLDYVPAWLPVLALGAGPRGLRHCVVVLSDQVVDPHPQQGGLVAVEKVYIVVRRPALKGLTS